MEINLEHLMARQMTEPPPDPKDREKCIKHLSKFKYEPYNEEFYETLVDYFSRKPLRGLALFGMKGIGKTYGLELMAYFKNIHFVTAAELAEAFSTGGSAALSAKAYPTFLGDENRPLDLIIDEIGREAIPVTYFGSSLNVIEEVLKKRYMFWDRHKARTILSGNLPLKHSNPAIVTVERLYGDHISERIEQMCEVPVCRGRNIRELLANNR